MYAYCIPSADYKNTSRSPQHKVYLLRVHYAFTLFKMYTGCYTIPFKHSAHPCSVRSLIKLLTRKQHALQANTHIYSSSHSVSTKGSKWGMLPVLRQTMPNDTMYVLCSSTYILYTLTCSSARLHINSLFMETNKLPTIWLRGSSSHSGIVMLVREACKYIHSAQFLSYLGAQFIFEIELVRLLYESTHTRDAVEY